MAEKIQIVPLSEDALNRYRITHPDRDLKPLLRRLHRLAYSSTTADEENVSSQQEDVEMIKLELMKWRASVERMMGSVSNLQRQREIYLRRAEETVKRTQELKDTLEGEKVLLAKKQRERDHEVKCDQVAAKITSRGKTRADLDEQITSLEQSIQDHKASHELYAQTVQTRVDLFSQITTLVEQVRATKLPIEPQSSIEEVEQPIPQTDNMEVDLSPSISTSNTGAGPSSAARLNASALPFQPTTTSSSSAPVSRHTSPGPSPASATPSSFSKPAPNHALPSRPARQSSAANSASSIPSTGHRLPSRPSTLRSVTTPTGAGGGSLEEGELGGEEEGEVNEDSRGTKRSAGSGPNHESRSRNTKPRK